MKRIKQNDLKHNLYFNFTIIFLLCCLGVFFIYIKNGLSLIYDGDGWSQHYKAYLYYSNYLKNIIKSIFINGKLLIPKWDFSIGEGAGIIETFHYYVIGDPFAFLVLFVPNRFVYLYYNFSIILRLFLSGVVFIHLCNYLRIENKYAVIGGSIVYVFCFWGLFNAVRHIYFLNPMFYMPLIILGIEKILREKKGHFFAIVVCVSSFSNFYFFYNIVLLTILYVAVRILMTSESLKNSIWNLIYIIKYSIIGVLMSSILLFPILYVFLNDARMGIDFNYHLVYPLLYYYKLPSMFVSTSRLYWLCMGFACPTILFLLITIKNFNRNRLLFVLELILLVLILFPIFGQIFNGFSYISNKWCFGLSLFVSFNLTYQWERLKENKVFVTVLFISFVFVCAFVGVSINIVIPLILCTLFLIVSCYLSINNEQLKNSIMILIIAVNVIFTANWQYSIYGSNYSSTATSIEDNKNIMQMSEAYDIFKNINTSENEFFRYSGSNLTQNASILFGVHSTDYYWSLTNPATAEYRSSLNLEEYKLYNFYEFDKRSTLYSVANVKYYVVPKEYKDLIPNGFEFFKSLEDNDLYINKNFLPFGFTYDKSISLEKWNTYNSVEKEQILSQAVVLEEDSKFEPNLNSKTIEFKTTCEKGIIINDNLIDVKGDGLSMLLTFEKDDTQDLYFSIKGLSYDDTLSWLDYKTTDAEIEIKYGTNINKSIDCRTKDDKYYNGRNDFTSYMGKCNSNTLKLTFLYAGQYSFENISLLLLKDSNQEERINKLSKDILENVVFDINTVKGTINLEEEKYLFLSIPYSKGWKAYVDGKQAELLKANVGYMALKLDKGNHLIELQYDTPLLKVGAIVSFISLALFVIDYIAKKRKRINE